MEGAEALRMRIDQMLLVWDIRSLLSGYNPKGFSLERAERALEAAEIDPDLLTLDRGDALKGTEGLLRRFRSSQWRERSSPDIRSG